MRVAIMGRSLRAPLTGVGRYTHNLVEAIDAEMGARSRTVGAAPRGGLTPERDGTGAVPYKDLGQGKDDLFVFVTRDCPAGMFNGSSQRITAPYATPNEYRRAFWEQTLVPRQVRELGIDLFHSPNYILPLTLACPTVVTIHDLVFRQMPHLHRWKSRLYLSWFTAWAVRRADRLIAVSETTARHLTHYYPQAEGKTVTIYQGLDSHFRTPPNAAEIAQFRERQGLVRPYILAVGTLEPRKNLPRLLEAFAQLVGRGEFPHELVICGPVGWHNQGLRQTLAGSSVRERIRFVGYVAQEALPLWYAAADLFVYPSLYEGFGLPPFEAMACNTPVVVSAIPSVLEKAVDAVVTVDPTCAEQIGAGMAAVLQNPSLVAELRAKGRACARQLEWRDAAAQILNVYRELI